MFKPRFRRRLCLSELNHFHSIATAQTSRKRPIFLVFSIPNIFRAFLPWKCIAVELSRVSPLSPNTVFNEFSALRACRRAIFGLFWSPSKYVSDMTFKRSRDYFQNLISPNAVIDVASAWFPSSDAGVEYDESTCFCRWNTFVRPFKFFV